MDDSSKGGPWPSAADLLGVNHYRETLIGLVKGPTGQAEFTGSKV